MHNLKFCAMLALVTMAGCSSRDDGASSTTGKTYVMGSPAAVGSLSYTVLHSSWNETLETGDGITTPKHRFLVLDVSIASGSAEEAGAPLLFLVDEKGKETMEEQKMNGLTGWLGLMRVIRPVETLSGVIVFDVPMANYKLKVSSGGDPEKEVEAFIDIPLRLEGQGLPGADSVPPASNR